MSEERVSFEYDFDKAVAALVFLASHPKVTNLDKKKAISLLFLADRAHLLRYGEPISGDSYLAMEYGTVPEHTLDILNAFLGERFWRGYRKDNPQVKRLEAVLEVSRVKGHEHPVLRAKVEPDLYHLSDLEIEVLEQVVKEYGRKTFEDLKRPLHPPAWKKAWDTRHNSTIDYVDFFESDADAAARQRMIEEFRFRRALSGS